MTEATQHPEGEMRWWQWHLGDRMALHQHPGQEIEDCSWPECAWHGIRPGEEHLIASLPQSPSRSVALGHLEALAIGEGGHFVYERDVIAEDDDDEDFEVAFES